MDSPKEALCMHAPRLEDKRQVAIRALIAVTKVLQRRGIIEEGTMKSCQTSSGRATLKAEGSKTIMIISAQEQDAGL